MNDYDRIAMVLDSEDAELARTTMRLVELGIDLMYAQDADEAELLAMQEAERMGAVLVPASADRFRLESLLSRVCPKLVAGARALVLVGSRPLPALVMELRDAGVAWRIWEPYTERELRFVMTAAMATEHGGERRKQVRIPTDVETTVFMGRHKKEVVLHDLSVGGAYFATPHPFLEGSRLHVEIPLADRVLHAKANVVNAKTADVPGRPDVPDGMGVVFTGLSPENEASLQGQIERFRGRFQLAGAE